MQQSYLIERHPSIRSQIVPFNVDYDEFYLELINYFKRQYQNGFQDLEIEFKLGMFVSKDPKNKWLLDIFKNLSRHRHVFITDHAQLYTFNPCFQLIYCEWDLLQNPQSLIILKNYFRQVNKQYRKEKRAIQFIKSNYIDPMNDNLLKSYEEGMRLDILFQSGERASIYYNGDKQLIKKERGESLDVMKDFIGFRLTTQRERVHNHNLIDQKIQTEPIKSVRFKQYTTVQYQFLRIDISRVLNVDDVHNVKNLIKFNTYQDLMKEYLLKLYNVDPSDDKNCLEELFLNHQGQQQTRKHEIEFEITDNDFVNQNLEPCIRRIIRNIDSFYYVNHVQYDIMFEQIKSLHPTSSRRQYEPPIIGSYLEKCYNQEF
ncbi:hypothetical protein pb186bvf_002493 [Paramecium bursaria]